MKSNISLIAVACSIFYLSSLSGCTDRIEDINPEVQDLTKVDLTGDWNAYGYTDLSGPIAIEIIRIERVGNTNEYVATKLLGDKAIGAGEITWYATFDKNPFKVVFKGISGNERHDLPTEMEVIDQNTMRTQCWGMSFSRRSEAYIP